MINLILPKPPSWNSLYRHNGYTVYMTSKGKDYIEDCGWRIRQLLGTPDPITVPVMLELTLYTCRDMDLDNSLKIIGDILSKHTHLIEDDKLITHIMAHKVRVKKSQEKVEITLSTDF